MSNETRMNRIVSYEEIKNNLIQSILENNGEFIERLYDIKKIRDKDAKNLLKGYIKKFKENILKINTKFKPYDCVIVKEKKVGSSYILGVQINNSNIIEFYFDDLYRENKYFFLKDAVRVRNK